jgi:hypothetical protein
MPLSMDPMLGNISLLPFEQLRVEDTVRDGLVKVLKTTSTTTLSIPPMPPSRSGS